MPTNISGEIEGNRAVVDNPLAVNLVSNSESINVQNPLPVDGDSVYAKDIWVAECNMYNFSGVPTDLFDNLHSIIEDTTSNNPKSVMIHFNRTIVSSSLALGAYTGDFSNVKIKLVGSGHTSFTVVDDSSNNTKYTGHSYQFPIIIGFNAIIIEFHTSDAVTLSNCGIGKSISVVARTQGVKPDGTIVDFGATAGGNQKFSLEEFDDTFLDTPLPVTKGFDIPIYDDITLGYTGDDLTTVIYKYLTVTVATITLSYTTGKLTGVVKT